MPSQTHSKKSSTNYKLSPAQVAQIKALVKHPHISRPALARHFGVEPCTINTIAWGMTWKAVKPAAAIAPEYVDLLKATRKRCDCQMSDYQVSQARALARRGVSQHSIAMALNRPDSTIAGILGGYYPAIKPAKTIAPEFAYLLLARKDSRGVMKLAREDVAQIRALLKRGANKHTVARRLNISDQYANAISHRWTWKNVKPAAQIKPEYRDLLPKKPPLSRAQVAQIRKLAARPYQVALLRLARRFGVHIPAIRKIVEGQIWPHIPPAAHIQPEYAGLLDKRADRRRKLTSEQVAQIKALVQHGAVPARLARHFKITDACVYCLLKGKSWKAVKPAKTIAPEFVRLKK